MEKLDIYLQICRINDVIEGVIFESVTGYSKVGDINSNSYANPLQYVARTCVRAGDDDVFDGTGNSVEEALEDLYKGLVRWRRENLI